MLGLFPKKEKKVLYIKCEPLDDIKWAEHTDNATPSHCLTVPFQSVAIFILFLSLIEPPKTAMLYVYIVCVHIQNHDVAECKYLPFSTKHWGLVCCEINQKIKKPTTQYCFSIIILCLWSHLWISIWTQCKLLGKPQLLRLPCERHSGACRCVTVRPPKDRCSSVEKDFLSSVPKVKESISQGDCCWGISTVNCLCRCKDGS